MFFGYALEDAMIYMKSVWAQPTSAPVLGAVVIVAAAAMLLVRAGVL